MPPGALHATMDLRITAWDAPPGPGIRPDVVQGLFILRGRDVRSAGNRNQGLAGGAGEEVNP